MNGEVENASGDFYYAKSMGPVGPTWAALCSQKPWPVKVNADLTHSKSLEI